VVVVDIIGVVKELPVPSEVPPVDAAYQSIVPVLVAPRVTVPASHLEPGVVPVMAGAVFTVATTAVLEAVVHPPEVAST